MNFTLGDVRISHLDDEVEIWFVRGVGNHWGYPTKLAAEVAARQLLPEETRARLGHDMNRAVYYKTFVAQE